MDSMADNLNEKKSFKDTLLLRAVAQQEGIYPGIIALFPPVLETHSTSFVLITWSPIEGRGGW